MGGLMSRPQKKQTRIRRTYKRHPPVWKGRVGLSHSQNHPRNGRRHRNKGVPSKNQYPWPQTLVQILVPGQAPDLSDTPLRANNNATVNGIQVTTWKSLGDLLGIMNADGVKSPRESGQGEQSQPKSTKSRPPTPEAEKQHLGQKEADSNIEVPKRSFICGQASSDTLKIDGASQAMKKSSKDGQNDVAVKRSNPDDYPTCRPEEVIKGVANDHKRGQEHNSTTQEPVESKKDTSPLESVLPQRGSSENETQLEHKADEEDDREEREFDGKSDDRENSPREVDSREDDHGKEHQDGFDNNTVRTTSKIQKRWDDTQAINKTAEGIDHGQEASRNKTEITPLIAKEPSEDAIIKEPPKSDPRPAGKPGASEKTGNYQKSVHAILTENYLPPPTRPTTTKSPKSSASWPVGIRSAQEQLGYLAFIEGGIYERTLDPDDKRLPKSLTRLLLQFARPLDYPPRSSPAAPLFVPKMLNQSDDDKEHNKAQMTGMASLAPSFILHIVDRADRCEKHRLLEDAWSQMVFYPLLREVLEADTTVQSHHVQGKVAFADPCPLYVTPCTRATIARPYQISGIPSRMVDYAITIDIDSIENKEVTQRVFQLRQQSSEDSINWTPALFLCQQPIAFPIEVKSRHGGFSEAKVQLGMWIVAQWRRLKELSTEAATPLDARRQGKKELSGEQHLPEFLLALFIQRHEWYLLVSTLEGNRVILWSHVAIGDTKSSLGVYRINLALRCIAKSIRTQYWPLFRRYYLGIS